MPDPRRAQPGVEMHCFVHEASRMVLLSAGERKGAVRCQTHFIQVTPSYKRQKKSVIPSGGLAVFRSQVQGVQRPAQRARN